MSWSHPAFAAIAGLLGARAGLQFTDASRPAGEAAILRAMERAGQADPAGYARLVRQDREALDALLAEVTVGETYFFREPGQFRFLKEKVLPGGRLPYRAWSAGCATGEEAYSLAMLFEGEGLAEAGVLGTDVSAAAIARAREGVYGPWSLRGEGRALAGPFLEPAGGRFRVVERVRRRVQFALLNLAEDGYPSAVTGTWGLDLILCRNVLVYFDPATVRAVAGRLFAALAPGGWLLTASSDPPLGGLAAFETRVSEAGVFYRRPLPVSEIIGEPVRVAGAEALRSPGEAPHRGVEDSLGVPATPPQSQEELAAQLREQANADPRGAERACALALRAHPLSAELHYLHALLLATGGDDGRAAAALRRVLFLDSTLAVAHFTLGALLERRGDPAGARRAYRRARGLAAARPADEPLPLGDGERAGELAAAAQGRLAALGAGGPRR
jgi:chemotaxis protein methyltransferase CheR